MTESHKIFLGIDYGSRRVGVAVGDLSRGLAFSHGTHEEGKDGSIFRFLGDIIHDKKVTCIVVGLPLTASFEEGESAIRAKKFAQRLAEEFGLPVELWDERYSSQEADRWLAQSKRPVKKDRDALAAEIILQSFLDSLASSKRDLAEES